MSKRMALSGLSIIGLVSLTLTPVAQEWMAQGQAVSVGAVSVIDGDTIRIGQNRVRLLAMDAPELAQECIERTGPIWTCGKEARAQLADIIENQGQPLRCAVMDTDQYGRDLAHCWAGGVNLSREMIACGYAVPYGYDIRSWAALVPAWWAHRGIWDSVFTWPSSYRKSQKGE